MASDEASDVVVDSLAASEEEAGALSLAVELLPLVAVCILMQILVLKMPHTEAIREFCSEYGFDSSEVAVIGDTLVDYRLTPRASTARCGG